MQESSSALDWIKICGAPDPELCKSLDERVKAHYRAGDFTWDDAQYVAKVDFSPIEERLTITKKRLEQLRRLCQLWDVKLRGGTITSHRKFVGPIIVACKKVLLSILRVLFKDTLHQQRSFNAATIELLAEMSEEVERLRAGRGG